MSGSVVVSGLGFVTSLGHARSAVSEALRSLRHGLAPWVAVPGMEVAVKLAGLLPGFEVGATNPAAWSWPDEFRIDANVARAMPPQGVYALAALQQALGEAQLSPETLGDGATGLYCASGGSPRMLHRHLGKLGGERMATRAPARGDQLGQWRVELSSGRAARDSGSELRVCVGLLLRESCVGICAG